MSASDAPSQSLSISSISISALPITKASSTAKLWAVVPAAGSGRRFGGDTPKQYLLLDHQPVILHSIQRLFSLPLAGCVLAISADDTQAHAVLDQNASLHFVIGGAERMDSVLAGLDYLYDQLRDQASNEDWILVHDVARPCIHEETLKKMLVMLENDPVGGILAIPVRDTLKRAAERNILATVSRDHLWQAQTPQMFRFGLLRAALRAAKAQGLQVTDEASAMELAGHTVRLVEGRMDNIKITYPDDLALAALILQSQRGY